MRLVSWINIFTLLGFVYNQSSTNVPKLIEAANTFSKILDYYTNKITNYKALNEEFEMLNKDVEFKKRKGLELSDKLNVRLENFFNEKEKALEILRKNVSSLRKVNQDEYLAPFDYPNIRSIKEKNQSLLRVVKDFLTDDPINDTISFVHVPINVNEKSQEILNTAKWTQNLDEIFKSNMNNDKSIYFQFYCDSSGLFRMFPGDLNGINNKDFNLYDCRRRVWYQRSSAAPKDIVIIIDRSGSMTGSNIAISKVAVKSIIDALGENDYFNVITVSDLATFVEPCVPYLMQATKLNKDRMQMAVDKIEKPRGVLNLAKGVTTAFEILNSVAANHRIYSAGCNKIIMVISDGIEGDYNAAAKDVFDRLNADKNVRVFSYLVGRVKNPDDRALKEMSCNNRGYFYKIETLGNVWDTVVEYFKVLSRPLASHEDEIKPRLSPIYLDFSGVNMVLTMSLGVFNEKNITGLVGVDMLIRTLKKAVPQYELGIFSHIALINKNGFIIVHPKFRDQVDSQSSPLNVYFEDLECSLIKNDSITLKEKMLKGMSGIMRFPSYWLYDNNRRIIMVNTTYYFNQTFNSEISSSLAMVDSDIVYVKMNRSIGNQFFKRGVHALKVVEPKNMTNTSLLYTYVEIPQWLFCDENENYTSDRIIDLKVFPSAANLESFLSVYERVDDVIDRCNEELITNLLVTAAIVYDYVNESCELHKNEDPTFRSLYVGTSGGYTRYFNKTAAKPDRDALRISLFEQATAMPNVDIIVSVPVHSRLNGEDIYVQVKASTWIKRNGERVLMAVIGTEMSSGLLKEMFDNSTKSIGLTCKNSSTVMCAIIDQNGYIVVSNQGDSSIGAFFGGYRGNLMSYLSRPDISIFKKIELEDTQTTCSKQTDSNSVANTLITPAKLFINLFGWIFYLALNVLHRALIYSVSKLHKTFAENQGRVSCSETFQYYLFQNDKWEEFYSKQMEQVEKENTNQATMRFECAPSKYTYFALAVIPKTNLIFIVVDTPSDNSCKNETLIFLKEKDHAASFCTQDEPFRVNPGFCYNESFSYESQSEFCGVGFSLRQSCVIVILLITLCFLNQ